MPVTLLSLMAVISLVLRLLDSALTILSSCINAHCAETFGAISSPRVFSAPTSSTLKSPNHPQGGHRICRCIQSLALIISPSFILFPSILHPPAGNSPSSHHFELSHITLSNRSCNLAPATKPTSSRLHCRYTLTESRTSLPTAGPPTTIQLATPIPPACRSSTTPIPPHNTQQPPTAPANPRSFNLICELRHPRR